MKSLPILWTDGLSLLAGLCLFWPAGVALVDPGFPLEPAAFWVAGVGGLLGGLLLWLAPERMAVLLAAWMPFSDLSSQMETPLVAQALPLALMAGLGARALVDGLNLRKPANLAFLAAAAWFLLSASLSGHAGSSLLSALAWILPFGGFFFFLQSRGLASPELREKLLDRMVMAAGLGGLLLLGYAFLWSPYPGKAAVRPFFLDANIFAAYLSLVLPALLWRMVRSGSRRRWVFAFLALVIFAGVLALRSRGAWIGLGGGLLLAVFFWLDNWLQRGLLLAGGLVLALVFAGVMRQYLEERPALPGDVRYLLSAGDLQGDFSNRERVMRWTCAWRMALDRPVLGHGPGNFAPDFKHHLRTDAEVRKISYWFGWTGGAHSVWLTALAETGWIGLLLLLGLVTGGFWSAWATRPGSFALIFALAIGGWAVHGIFNDLLMVGAIAGMSGMVFGESQKRCGRKKLDSLLF